MAAGLVALCVGKRTLDFRHPVRQSIACRAFLMLPARDALANIPQIDDLSHAPARVVAGYTVVGCCWPIPSAPITPIPWRGVHWADDATYVNTMPVVKLRASTTRAQYTLS